MYWDIYQNFSVIVVLKLHGYWTKCIWLQIFTTHVNWQKIQNFHFIHREFSCVNAAFKESMNMHSDFFITESNNTTDLPNKNYNVGFALSLSAGILGGIALILALRNSSGQSDNGALRIHPFFVSSNAMRNNTSTDHSTVIHNKWSGCTAKGEEERIFCQSWKLPWHYI